MGRRQTKIIIDLSISQTPTTAVSPGPPLIVLQLVKHIVEHVARTTLVWKQVFCMLHACGFIAKTSGIECMCSWTVYMYILYRLLNEGKVAISQ